MECVQEIGQSPWFERLWTLQEIAFAREAIMVCGRDAISWDCYERAIPWAPLCLPMSAEIVQRFFWKHKLQRMSTSDARSRLIVRSRDLKAIRPHDNIYGLYGILNSLGLPMPLVDYRKPVPTLFEEFTVMEIKHSNSLSILQDLPSTSRRPDLPSWVPDWSEVGVHIYLRDRDLDSFCATADSKPMGLHEVQGQLSLAGKVFDRVKCRGMALPAEPWTSNYDRSYDFDAEAIKVFRSWLQIVTRRDSIQNEDAIPARFYEALTIGQEHELRYDPDTWKLWSQINLGNI